MITLLNKHIHCCNAGHTVFKRTLSTNKLKDYYGELRVDKSSTPKEIKASFLRLSKVYHPDNKLTGSHLKFVQLKEAYDAIKDGSPKVTPTSSYHQTDSQEYDLSHKAHARYREQTRSYDNPYDNPQYGFGGPYADSSHPWEEMMKSRAYRKQKENFASRAGKPLTNLTLLLGAISWIVLYSSVLLIWDYNDNVKDGYMKHRVKHRDEFMSFDSYLKKREAAQNVRPTQYPEYETVKGVPLRDRGRAPRSTIPENPGHVEAPSRE